ncbi:MAG: cytochrome c [Thermoanaerobaculia bacterium]
MSRVDATPATKMTLVARTGLLAVLALAGVACRQDMHDQPKLKPYRSSTFFADGSGMRALPAHTVARGSLHEDTLFYAGRTADGSITAELPMPMTRALLERGQDRFNIYCTPCHGKVGDGRGMVVRRGYKQPTSFHDERLRQVPIGYLFDVMTNGFGVMATYAPQIPPEDRWAIAAYIRALQLSQHIDAASLTPEQRASLDAPAAVEGAEEHGGHAAAGSDAPEGHNP